MCGLLHDMARVQGMCNSITSRRTWLIPRLSKQPETARCERHVISFKLINFVDAHVVHTELEQKIELLDAEFRRLVKKIDQEYHRVA